MKALASAASEMPSSSPSSSRRSSVLDRKRVSWAPAKVVPPSSAQVATNDRLSMTMDAADKTIDENSSSRLSSIAPILESVAEEDVEMLPQEDLDMPDISSPVDTDKVAATTPAKSPAPGEASVPGIVVQCVDSPQQIVQKQHISTPRPPQPKMRRLSSPKHIMASLPLAGGRSHARGLKALKKRSQRRASLIKERSAKIKQMKEEAKAAGTIVAPVSITIEQPEVTPSETTPAAPAKRLAQRLGFRTDIAVDRTTSFVAQIAGVTPPQDKQPRFSETQPAAESIAIEITPAAPAKRLAQRLGLRTDIAVDRITIAVAQIAGVSPPQDKQPRLSIVMDDEVTINKRLSFAPTTPDSKSTEAAPKVETTPAVVPPAITPPTPEQPETIAPSSPVASHTETLQIPDPLAFGENKISSPLRAQNAARRRAESPVAPTLTVETPVAAPEEVAPAQQPSALPRLATPIRSQIEQRRKATETPKTAKASSLSLTPASVSAAANPRLATPIRQAIHSGRVLKAASSINKGIKIAVIPRLRTPLKAEIEKFRKDSEETVVVEAPAAVVATFEPITITPAEPVTPVKNALTVEEEITAAPALPPPSAMKSRNSQRRVEARATCL